jgi:hypothetical protein
MDEVMDVGDGINEKPITPGSKTCNRKGKQKKKLCRNTK